jgi:hypothetical protein
MAAALAAPTPNIMPTAKAQTLAIVLKFVIELSCYATRARCPTWLIY